MISNDAIDLCPDKQAVFRASFRVLRPGGRRSSSRGINREAGVNKSRRRDMGLGLGEEGNAVWRDTEAARQELLGVLSPLTDGDLTRSLRGGWSVRRVIEHIIQSEWHYAHLVQQLRELPPTAPPSRAVVPSGISEAMSQLTASRQALLGSLDGIDEEAFYQLRPVGREEYSVLSVLENVAHHDREHGGQIQSIVAAM